MQDKIYEEIAKGNVSYFYTSRTWRRKRKEIIKRDNNECQMCKRNGKVTVGTEEEPLIAHHKKELKQHPNLALVDSNLLSVCNDCHENVCHPERLGKYKKRKQIVNEERW